MSKSIMADNNDLIIRYYDGHPIRQREDGYFSATDMCQSVGKNKAYLNSFSRKQRTRILMKYDVQNDFIVKDSEGIWYSRPLSMELAYSLHCGLSLSVNQWIIWEPLESINKVEEFCDNFVDIFSSSLLISSSTVLVTEFNYRDHLQSLIGGETEVSLDGGKYRIDLLTDDSVIEVKFIPDWLKGLKQVNIYSTYYPTKKKKLALFGHSRQQNLSYIRAYCSQVQVEVLYINSNGLIHDETDQQS